MAKKKKELSLEEKLEQALVPDNEQRYSIPNNWSWVYHNSLLEISGGSQPAKSHFVSEPTEGYIQLYQTRDY
jgi:type I restriction enzyme S subunit